MAAMNGQLIPYNGSYQPAVPIVGQPTGVVQPGSVMPSYVGTATAGNYLYTNPMYSPYPAGLDYGYYPDARGYRSGRYGKRRRYPRTMDPRMMDPRMMDPRMMDPLYEIERMRALEIAELSYGTSGYGYGGGGYSRGIMDDGYYGYGGYGGYGYGSRGYGLCGYPHRRGIMCPECDYDPYY